MKNLFWGLLMSLFMNIGANAQTVEGDWQGTIKADDVELRLRLHVTKDEKGAGKKPVRVEVDLWHTAIRIAKGNRLVVDIASASFPVYARNLNTGENSLTGAVYRKAKVSVHRSAEFPSFVEFSSVTGADRK